MKHKKAELLIPEISEATFEAMTPAEQRLYLKLYREQVAPIFEAWRYPARVKAAFGGRGAGAKSRSAGSLLLQFGEDPSYFGKSFRCICLRDVQKSIAQSSWLVLKDELARLGYAGWEVTRDEIRNTKNGSYFRFQGLNDMSASQVKSLESYDCAFIEECAPVSMNALLTLLATIRKQGSEIWALWNPVTNHDPAYELFVRNPEPGWTITRCRPGALDNPWWDMTTLQRDWERLAAVDPDEARHQFEGLPRAQGSKAVFSQGRVQAMVDREITDEGAVEIGCDVARFGKDGTHAYKRKGMRIVQHEWRHGYGTVEVAGMLWDEMAGRDPSIPIKVDSGYNPGVIDLLSSWGANVVSVGFGEKAVDEDSFGNAASEMMFSLPVDEISIPEVFMTQTLFEDLTERFFGYDSRGRKKIEPKDGTSTTEDGGSKKNFKDRHGGRSPDEGDALCLTFYEVSAGGCY